MNAHTALTDFLVGLDYAGRCPSWAEYENGVPAEKRAITTRWVEIIHLFKSGDDRQFKSEALKNYSKYCAQLKAQRPLNRSPSEPESAQAQWYRGEPVGPDTSEDYGL